MRNFLFPLQVQQTLSQSAFQVVRGTMVSVQISCFKYFLQLSPCIFIIWDIPLCRHPPSPFHPISPTCKGHVHSSLSLSSKPWCLLCHTGSLRLYLVSELLGEDKMTPPLLLFPIFREASYIDGSSIKMLTLKLKVAGRRGNKLGLVAVPVARNARLTCIPSRSA